MADPKHKGTGFWERLQPRERVLVMLLVAVFFVVATAVMMFIRYKKMQAIDEQIADLRGGLELTRTYGAAYKDKLASKNQQSDDISSTPLLFATLVEEAQTIAEVKASSQNEKPAVELAPGLRKRTYEFDLKGVTLAQLTKFLSTVESKEGHVVMTEALTIRSTNPVEDRLTANVVLATWERVEAETSEDEEQEQP
jgi:hypothetical protein